MANTNTNVFFPVATRHGVVNAANAELVEEAPHGVSRANPHGFVTHPKTGTPIRVLGFWAACKRGLIEAHVEFIEGRTATWASCQGKPLAEVFGGGRAAPRLPEREAEAARKAAEKAVKAALIQKGFVPCAHGMTRGGVIVSVRVQRE